MQGLGALLSQFRTDFFLMLHAQLVEVCVTSVQCSQHQGALYCDHFLHAFQHAVTSEEVYVSPIAYHAVASQFFVLA